MRETLGEAWPVGVLCRIEQQGVAVEATGTPEHTRAEPNVVTEIVVPHHTDRLTGRHTAPCTVEQEVTEVVTEIDGPQMCPRTTIIVAVTLQGVMGTETTILIVVAVVASEGETGVVIVAADTSWRGTAIPVEVEVGETTVETGLRDTVASMAERERATVDPAGAGAEVGAVDGG